MLVDFNTPDVVIAGIARAVVSRGTHGTHEGNLPAQMTNGDTLAVRWETKLVSTLI
jgi:hypothetical protein